MEILRQARDLAAGERKVCLAIGMFDGVHLGHQQVLKQSAIDAQQHDALSLAVTFDKHPNAIVAPDRAPLLLYSLPQKLRAIAESGVNAVLVIEFNEAFSKQTGEQFIRSLARDLGQIDSICVGSAFTFGHKRGGNVDLLQALGAELHFRVHGLAAVSLGGKVVSSTRIRERVAMGDFDSASQMLGRSYAMSGNVVEGDHLARKMGVPTANIDIRGLVTPPRGVYAVQVRTGSNTFRGVANLGFRPTLAKPELELRLEVHLLDFDSDLYGVELEVRFADFLRPELRFSSLEELQRQIVADLHAARKLFGVG